MSLVDLVLGKRLRTEHEDRERIGAIGGVGVLGLDALASAAYGPEALLTVLLPIGVAAERYVATLTSWIGVLLVIVFLSYRQTIDAYPGGGGAYTVAKENLGTAASVLAAAALALDYLLNVAVAVSAGIGALVSAVPSLLPFTLPLCLGVLLLLTLLNLRGASSTSAAFLVPTYAFVGGMLALIGVGAARALLHGGHPAPVVPPPAPLPAADGAAVSGWLLARAFASGCTAMTGVEAVSNGVPLFREPSTVRARRTLTAIIAVLLALLFGVAGLCRAYRVTATPPGERGYESVLSQLAGAVVGRGVAYHAIIGVMIAVLSLSANTSFADFPRLCRVLAVDRFLPEAFAHRGRRMAFSHGILVLSALSAVLLVIFGGVTAPLIPLFAIGAFLAFTMSQAGMIEHWRRRLRDAERRERRRARRSLVLNAVGTAATAVTLCVVLASKLTEGAWISVLLVAGMVALMRAVRAHYDAIDRAVALGEADALTFEPPRAPICVVPLRRWDAVALKAVNFARGLTADVVAVQVLAENGAIEDLRGRWPQIAEQPAAAAGAPAPRLVVLTSTYRELFEPLLRFVTALSEEHSERVIAVVVPELVERRWYHYLWRNHTASLLKALLLFRGGPRLVVMSTPSYLDLRRGWIRARRPRAR